MLNWAHRGLSPIACIVTRAFTSSSRDRPWRQGGPMTATGVMQPSRGDRGIKRRNAASNAPIGIPGDP
eukprot:1393615-Amorphochlora_amoeboformis.AAC.2